MQKKGTNKKFSLLRARDKRRKERTRTGATVFMDMVVNILVGFVLCVCFIWGSAWRRKLMWKGKKVARLQFFFPPPAYLILDFLSCLGSGLLTRELNFFSQREPPPQDSLRKRGDLTPSFSLPSLWRLENLNSKKTAFLSVLFLSQRLSSPKFFTFHILFEVYADSIRVGKHTHATQYYQGEKTLLEISSSRHHLLRAAEEKKKSIFLHSSI